MARVAHNGVNWFWHEGPAIRLEELLGQPTKVVPLRRAMISAVAAAGVCMALSGILWITADASLARYLGRESVRAARKRPPLESVKPAGSLLVVGSIALWIASGAKRRILLTAVLALAISAAVVPLAKGFVQRPRPAHLLDGRGRMPDRFFGSWSYPSGDVTNATAFVVVLLPFVRRRWWGYAIPLLALVALRRMIWLRHYPSDCLAGGAFGALSALAAWTVHNRWIAGPRPAESIKERQR
jgi:membrane-associated phospholipid phosphatase